LTHDIGNKLFIASSIKLGNKQLHAVYFLKVL